MAANDRHAADQGGARPFTYPVSLQQAAAAIFGITPLGEQIRRGSAPTINPNRKTDRENQ
ncbi:hypothetical protein MRBLMC3_001351 [Sphingobium sp. LMC3-1-1.1]|uniref:hypothetical protein n=1 Tax=Sphingobium sp. LMC3-1-1.1 TaxID=3135241 RepID=UPI00341A3BF4